jgi:hypothetical protein
MKEYESPKLKLYRSESYNNQHGEIRHLFDRSVCKSHKVLLGKDWADLLTTTIDITYEKQSTLWTGATRCRDARNGFVNKFVK